MSTGNPVNNQIPNDQQPLTPAAQPDPAAQQQENQVAQQGPISVGSPESWPMIPSQPESKNATPEYGYEELKRIEQAPESISAAERKESSPQQRQQPKQQPAQQPVQKPTPAPPPQPQGPKVFGYSIPPALVNNFKSVAKSKSKGNPKDSSTWVVMLLDRILKKQKGI